MFDTDMREVSIFSSTSWQESEKHIFQNVKIFPQTQWQSKYCSDSLNNDKWSQTSQKYYLF